MTELMFLQVDII